MALGHSLWPSAAAAVLGSWLLCPSRGQPPGQDQRGSSACHPASLPSPSGQESGAWWGEALAPARLWGQYVIPLPKQPRRQDLRVSREGTYLQQMNVFRKKNQRKCPRESCVYVNRPKPAGPPEKGFRKNPGRRATFYFLGVAINLLRVDLRHLSNKHVARRLLHSSSHLWWAPGLAPGPMPWGPLPHCTRVSRVTCGIGQRRWHF